MITLGENTAITEVQKEALGKARDYLRKQLLKPSPNVQTIYSTIKSYVDSHPQLLQMVNNELALANLAYGWTITSMNNPANNNDRARYLIVIHNLLAILA